MAIIKCPECGRQVSDKAPVCPSCGVEIAAKVTACPQCGEVYFKDNAFCPNCQHATVAEESAAPSRPENLVPVSEQSEKVEEISDVAKDDRTEENRGKGGYVSFVVALVVAAVIAGGCLYFYHASKTNKEAEAYRNAMASTNPLSLQSYLDSYKDAPAAHLDSVRARVERLRKVETDWTDAVVANSRTQIEAYMAKYPDSPHRAEAMHKIDSMDWEMAAKEDTEDGYSVYLGKHPDGEYAGNADEAVKKIRAKVVTPEEKSAVATAFSRFFQSVNSRDEEALLSTVSTFLTNFLGKAEATKGDVATFMRKIYKEDIKSMEWRTMDDYRIDKKEVGDGKYEYSVQFTATQDIDREDETAETSAKYRAKGKVGPDGKISELTLIKVVE